MNPRFGIWLEFSSDVHVKVWGASPRTCDLFPMPFRFLGWPERRFSGKRTQYLDTGAATVERHEDYSRGFKTDEVTQQLAQAFICGTPYVGRKSNARKAR